MKRILSHFDLKIIAIISMTLDHIGRMLLLFLPYNDGLSVLSYILTIIGRLAFPIFIFLIIEGFYHTKNIAKYFIRLSLMALIVYIGLFSVTFLPLKSNSFETIKIGNIFIDLILSLLFIYLINKKGLFFKLLILPIIGYFLLFLFIQNNIIIIDGTLKTILAGLAPQYAFITPIILVLYFLFTFINNYYEIKKSNIIDKQCVNYAYTNNLFKREYIYSFTIIILVFILYALTFISGIDLNTDLALNTYFIFSIIPIILYNGNLGKNNKIIQGAFYLYYPVSICIIYLVFYLITLI